MSHCFPFQASKGTQMHTIIHLRLLLKRIKVVHVGSCARITEIGRFYVFSRLSARLRRDLARIIGPVCRKRILACMRIRVTKKEIRRTEGSWHCYSQGLIFRHAFVNVVYSLNSRARPRVCKWNNKWAKIWATSKVLILFLNFFIYFILCFYRIFSCLTSAQ